MTDTTDGDEGIGESGGSSDAEGPDFEPGSQFEEFHERLDERESNRTRSTTESDSKESEERNETVDPTRTKAESVGSDASDEEADATAGDTAATDSGMNEPDDGSKDWIWGSQTPFDENDPVEFEDRAETEESEPDEEDRTDGSEHRPRGSSDTDGRIWDAETIEGIGPDESDAEDVPADSPKVTETSERSRWSELRASLEGEPTNEARASAETERPIGDEQPETDRSSGESPSSRNRASDVAIPQQDISNDLDRTVSSSSVLLLGPTDHPVSDSICSRFLTVDGEPRNVIFVTFDDSPNERLEICHQSSDWSGGKVGIIEVGRGSRNAPAASEITGGDRGSSITIKHITNPGDLSKLGIVITQLLSAFDETNRGTVLCFHTLSALHKEVGTKTLFRFLNTLQRRLQSTDAVGHYHVDPDLHDEIVIETLRPIFETEIRFTAEGELEIA